jgi:hypothetical protein
MSNKTKAGRPRFARGLVKSHDISIRMNDIEYGMLRDEMKRRSTPEHKLTESEAIRLGVMSLQVTCAQCPKLIGLYGPKITNSVPTSIVQSQQWKVELAFVLNHIPNGELSLAQKQALNLGIMPRYLMIAGNVKRDDEVEDMIQKQIRVNKKEGVKRFNG